MSDRHISHRAEFGVALHESGLNLVSAALRVDRPDLFAHRTVIPIVAPTPGQPGHDLTLYAIVSEPIAFNLYPVDGVPAVETDGFYLRIDLMFTLTDSRLGPITRIRAVAEAAAQVTRSDQGLRLRLLPKADGTPWFDIVTIDGAHPEVAVAPDALGAELVAGIGDEATARTFRAIVRYLIEVFLRSGLQKTAEGFPLPDLKNLIEVGKLGHLSGRSIYVRNNALYLTLGDETPGGMFPVAAPEAHLAVGATERGLRRAVRSFLPLPIDLDVGHDRSTIRLWSENFRISDLHLNVLPGEDKLAGRIFFGGTVFLSLQFEVFGEWIRTPGIPFPVDASLSHYAGYFLPFIEVREPGSPDGTVELRIRPNQDFLEHWYAFVVTNYREVFKNLLRRALDPIRDRLRRNKFCKIPILGWIVCGVIDLFADVVGWVVGAVLDALLVVPLNILLNTAFRAVLSLLQEQRVKVFGVEQRKVQEATGLLVSGGSVAQVEDSRGGELQLRLNLAGGAFPVPTPPLPAPQDPAPAPIPPPPDVATTELPEYPEASFQPPFVLPSVSWTHDDVQRFQVKLEDGPHGLEATGMMEVRFERVGASWRLTRTSSAWDVTTNFVAEYDAEDFSVRRCEYRTRGHHPETGLEVVIRHQVDFEAAGTARVAMSQSDERSIERSVPILDRARFDFEELWIFRFAHAALVPAEGTIARIEVSDPFAISNWARQIPVSIRVTEEQVVWPPNGHDVIDVWLVIAEDEESTTRLKIARDGSGILHGIVTKGASRFTFSRES